MFKLVVITLVLAVACNADGKRIVGGQNTSIERYPYIVQVENLGILTGEWSQACAANILNQIYILSAAHCFAGQAYDPSLRRIRAGTSNRGVGGQVVFILREYNHPSYGVVAPYDGDISVVRLASFMDFTNVIRPVSLLGPNAFIPDNSPVVHVGWGRVTQGGAFSPILQDTQIFTVNHAVCRERYQSLPSPGTVTDNMICAGVLDVGGRDACQGDAGGPLYFGNEVLIGIISWGHRCANATFPGINTAVSPYVEWIAATAV